MDIKKIIIGILAVVIIIILAFLGFSFFGKNKGLGNTPRELSWWGYKDSNQGIEYLIDEYKKDAPHITIKYSKKGNSPEEYQQIINDALAKGEGPDIFQIRNDWTPVFNKKVAQAPNNIYTAESFRNTFYEVASKDLIYDEKVYAIPFEIETLTTFYSLAKINQREVRNATTWTELQDRNKIARQLRGDFVDKAGVAMGTANNVEYAEDILYLLMLQNQTVMTSEDNKIPYFNVAAKNKYGDIIYPGASALDYYTSYANPTRETYTWRQELSGSLPAFSDGKVHIVFAYPSDKERVQNLNKDLEFKLVPAPQIEGGAEEVYLAKYWANSVSIASDYQTDAWNFLKFASGKDMITEYGFELEMAVANKEAEKKLSGNKNLKQLMKEAKNAKSWYKADWLKTDNAIKEAITNVVVQKQDSRSALDQAAKKVKEIFDAVHKD